ncbi:MAG TPA: DUF1667 domain-containing protein [Candidatus Altiarchaeales archaeon]|nr:DUF1667 domain-containing protein [Candidatus Altiarchaeales archaeon]
MPTKKFVCIVCPNSCEIYVSVNEKNEILKLEGNLCPRGEDYVRKELKAPERVVTSTVRVRDGNMPLVSVKTSKPIPKEKIFEVMEEIRKLEVRAPIKIGDVLLKNIAGTSADLVATKNVLFKKNNK